MWVLLIVIQSLLCHNRDFLFPVASGTPTATVVLETLIYKRLNIMKVKMPLLRSLYLLMVYIPIMHCSIAYAVTLSGLFFFKTEIPCVTPHSKRTFSHTHIKYVISPGITISQTDYQKSVTAARIHSNQPIRI